MQITRCRSSPNYECNCNRSKTSSWPGWTGKSWRVLRRRRRLRRSRSSLSHSRDSCKKSITGYTVTRYGNRMQHPVGLRFVEHRAVTTVVQRSYGYHHCCRTVNGNNNYYMIIVFLLLKSNICKSVGRFWQVSSRRTRWERPTVCVSRVNNTVKHVYLAYCSLFFSFASSRKFHNEIYYPGASTRSNTVFNC